MKILPIFGILLLAAWRGLSAAPGELVAMTLTSSPVTLESKPPAQADPWWLTPSEETPSSARGMVFLETQGSLSMDRSGQREVPAATAEGLSFSRILDSPGPGYRHVVEWFENMSRPTPRLNP